MQKGIPHHNTQGLSREKGFSGACHEELPQCKPNISLSVILSLFFLNIPICQVFPLGGEASSLITTKLA